jgi:hypothetical protein
MSSQSSPDLALDRTTRSAGRGLDPLQAWTRPRGILIYMDTCRSHAPRHG